MELSKGVGRGLLVCLCIILGFDGLARLPCEPPGIRQQQPVLMYQDRGGSGAAYPLAAVAIGGLGLDLALDLVGRLEALLGEVPQGFVEVQHGGQVAQDGVEVVVDVVAISTFLKAFGLRQVSGVLQQPAGSMYGLPARRSGLCTQM